MINPLAALFRPIERKAFGGALGSLIGEYLRGESDAVSAYSEDHAFRVAVFASCTRILSATIASTPLHVLRRLERGKERVGPANSLAKLLERRPNPIHGPMELRDTMTSWLVYRGNAYAWINWVEVVVKGERLLQAQELWPLHPDRVEAIVGGPELTPTLRYAYIRRNGDRIPIPFDEMLHVRGLSSDGIVGRSLLSDARETLGVALSTQRYAKGLFDRDATPGVVLRHPGKFKDDKTRQRLKEDWDAMHAGDRNSRRTAILEEDMKLERVSMTPEDSQFLETRKFQRSEIAGLFPVPPHLIGDVDRSTSWGTGIEQQAIGWLVYGIRPWYVRWEQAIARCLILREEDLTVEHKVEGLLRGDSTARSAFYRTMVELGIMTRNECRALENLNPLDGLDEPLTPLNMGRTSESEGGAP